MGVGDGAVPAPVRRSAAGHSQSLETVKDFVEERPRRFVDAGRLTFAWSRYADDAIRLCGTAKAGSGAVDIFRPRDIEINDGTSQFMRVKNGALCAFRTQASIVEQNNQHIAIAHIPFGALNRIAQRCLLQHGIEREKPRWARQILGPTAFRAPPSAGDALLDRRIESRAIDTGLAARENLQHADHCLQRVRRLVTRLAVAIRRAEDMALRRQHHLIKVSGKHGCGEEGDGAERLLAGVLEVVPHRRRQNEHAAETDRGGRAVLDIELALWPAMTYCVSSVASVCQPSPGSIL
jgi:hypothetical protein